MSEEKQIEQEIGWYKVIFAILIATDLSLLAWFFQNMENASPKVLVFTSIAMVVVTLGIIAINMFSNFSIAYANYKLMENLFIFSFGVFILGLVVVVYQAITYKPKKLTKLKGTSINS